MKILFLDLSTKLKTITDLDTQARGGMVTSLFKVSDELSRLGHEVAVLSDIESGGVTPAGVEWLTDLPEQFFDILICNRGVGSGYPEIQAKRRVLWTHDLPHNGFIQNPMTIRAFAATVFMSHYGERIWRTFYQTIGKSVLIPNGVDRKTFYPRPKNPDYLIYISAPNRGLKELPLLYEATQSRLKRPLKMRAYSNLAKLHPNEGPDNFLPDYKSCAEAGIEVMDPIPQHELAVELGQAAIMVLPTNYPEICSNAVLQSLACGTPVITTGNLGATPEWVKHRKNGMLTEYQPSDYMVYQLQMVRNMVEVMDNPKLLARMQRNASTTRGIYSWQIIGRMWNKFLSRLG